MRIGVNCFLLQPNMGGMKQYFFNLFRELLQNHSRYECVLFYFAHNIQELSELDEEGWQQHAILLNDQEEIRNHLDKIDLFFHPFGTLWPRPLPLPSVVTLVDIQEVFYPQFFTDLDMYNREYHFQGSTHIADQVITISHFSKQTIVKHHRISPKKVTVAHLCADERFYRAAEIAAAPTCSLPQANNYVVYPANHWFHKNHDNLLLALKKLKEEQNICINAVFTGYDVPGGYQITDKADEYGLSEQVYLTGYVSVPELAYLYQHARALIFPSLFEGFGIPLVEAMAAGCPVLTAEITSLPEITLDAAIYFNPESIKSIAQALERVWDDKTLREQLVRKGYQRAQEFSAAKLAEVHLQVFTEAVNAYSTLRFMWNRWIYHPYHRAYVDRKYHNILHK